MNTACSSDRSHLPTEQSLTESRALDAMTIRQTLELMNRQDQAVPEAVQLAIPSLTRLVESIVDAFGRKGRLIYLGAGTSGRLGVLDASECPPTFQSDPDQVVGLIAGGDAALRKSSESKEDDPQGAIASLKELALGSKDVVVGLAAGGSTPYVHGALQYAKSCGSVTGLIACVKLNAPAMAAYVDHPVELLVGPEVLTGSTRLKAGTATKLALNMITTTAMVQSGKAWGNLMVDVRATNAKLQDRAIRILTSQTNLNREQAADLLGRARGHVKLALVMELRSLGLAEAKELLAQHGGHLRPILGEPK